MKFDKRRKYYLVLDCETCTLPFANEFKCSKDIALAKPLIYDIGWQVVDKKGKVYKKVSYLVSEIFFNLNVFNTGYYANKRPIYFNEIQNGTIKVASWQDIAKELVADLDNCEMCGAYNSYFDFKKAIPFTERYINSLYDNSIDLFLEKQKYACECIENKVKSNFVSEYNNMVFNFKGNEYKIFDIWFMACKNIINTKDYKDFCYKNKYFNKYFSTSAEIVYRYLNENNFVEQHRAIQDTEIETEIFAKSVSISKEIEQGIVAFPFRVLGTIKQYEKELSVG